MYDPVGYLKDTLPLSNSAALLVFIGLVLWTALWKGLALWRAARRSEKAWFIVFIFVHTLGFLEILYLYAFSKKNWSGEASQN